MLPFLVAVSTNKNNCCCFCFPFGCECRRFNQFLILAFCVIKYNQHIELNDSVPLTVYWVTSKYMKYQQRNTSRQTHFVRRESNSSYLLISFGECSRCTFDVSSYSMPSVLFLNCHFLCLIIVKTRTEIFPHSIDLNK